MKRDTVRIYSPDSRILPKGIRLTDALKIIPLETTWIHQNPRSGTLEVHACDKDERYLIFSFRPDSADGTDLVEALNRASGASLFRHYLKPLKLEAYLSRDFVGISVPKQQFPDNNSLLPA